MKYSLNTYIKTQNGFLRIVLVMNYNFLPHCKEYML